MQLTEKSALKEFESAARSLTPYPDGFCGKGIVICGGGLKYFPCAWVCINRLRDFGCELPIELWYLGAREMTPTMQRLVEPLGVDELMPWRCHVIARCGVPAGINSKHLPRCVRHSKKCCCWTRT